VSRLDRLKEEVGYLKLLQGIAVVTFASLVGWLVSGSSSAAALTVVSAIAGVLLVGIAILLLHRNLRRRLDEIESL